MAKRVAFCTFGCRLNQYDSETLRSLLERDGDWRTVAPREPADVYVINTCSVTARADASARKAVRRIHSQRPAARIVVTGCYAQRAAEELAALPGVALVLGTGERGSIAARLASLPAPGKGPEIAVSPVEGSRAFLDVPVTGMMEHTRALVKVQEGCNHACTFCIVPRTRGPSRSRAPASVLEQVRALLDRGYGEIVLTGVHLGDYGLDLPGGGPPLVGLLEALLGLEGLRRLRLSSIEPASVDSRLVELMGAEPRLARHLHMPVQSGSDRVLERMGRRYRAAQFADLVARIAEQVPGCGIGSDVICGFPGEEEADFERTFELLERLPLSYLHAFTYSPRPGSPAEAFGDQVPGEVKKRRTRALKRLSAAKNRRFREAHLGAVVEVLLEPGRRAAEARRCGWTDNYLRVELAAGAPSEGWVRARITALGEEGLLGEPL